VKAARGIVASGHPETSKAAAEILRAGGNAYDAVIAALCVACVAEPLLVSLGGGGFLTAAPANANPVVYDFFCQTPSRHQPESELDFYPIMANFGADQQEFHVGRGSIAVPGLVAGIFGVHQDLGRMPLAEVMQPATSLARDGVHINALQQYIIGILEPILRADPAAFSLFESSVHPGKLLHEGETFRNPELATAFEALLEEGPGLLYGGDWAKQLVTDCQDGGSLQLEDLARFQLERREPLRFEFAGMECLINAPPSPGGALIAFALGLIDGQLAKGQWGGPDHLVAMVSAMNAASLARDRYGLQREADDHAVAAMLEQATVEEWRSTLRDHRQFSRGTTHISVADRDGNMASLTASNGEGSAYVLPGTGIMLNNMLGEEDLNPGGFHQWYAGRRLASMMSPLVARGADGFRLALGTGGSNRIRSAITQVMVNALQFKMPLEQAIRAPRMHLEGSKLSLEPGFGAGALAQLSQQTDVPGLEMHQWPDHNLFFGGVHAVQTQAGAAFDGAGDARRDGAVVIA
jgi:gamma-glutamyltranspeptidase/glutathione hydrolase